MSKRIWDDIIPPKDRQVIEKSGWGKRRGYGKKPAVLVVDAQYSFVGAKEDILNSLSNNSMGIGNDAWAAVGKIQELLMIARSKGIPVFFTKGKREKSEQHLNWTMYKRYITDEPEIPGIADSSEIVAELTPKEDEIVICKRYPSAFFGTPLTSYLVSHGIDTLLVVGFVTSGCIRATVNDACQYGYNTIVIEDCVADRITISHQIELLDMDLKYADVEPLDEVFKYLSLF